jgi:hypothetical protein
MDEQADKKTWLKDNLTALVTLGLGCFVGYLAMRGNEKAVDVLIGAFGILSGVNFGVRAALKIPGKDS